MMTTNLYYRETTLGKQPMPAFWHEQSTSSIRDNNSGVLIS